MDELGGAVHAYRGPVLVVSHDDGFLDRLGLDVRLELGDDGRLDEP